MAPLRFGSLVGGMMIFLVAAVAEAAGPTPPSLLDSPEARDAERVLCGYVGARNDHDFSRARSFSADAIRWLDGEGRDHPKNDARLRTMLSWEAVMAARWTCRAIGFADGWLEAEISERNRMYDALDVGAVVQRDRVRVAGGQIREGRTLAEWTTGRPEEEAFAEFRTWLKALPAGRRAGVLRGGNLMYDAEGARRTIPLLDAWERAHPPARQLLAEALDALGGEKRVAALDGWIVEGRGRENLSAELQGLTPGGPTWRPHREKVGVVRASGSVAWERRTARNDRSLRWRRFIETPDAFGVVDWTSGYGALRPAGVAEADREALMRRIPHLLLVDVLMRSTRLIAARSGGSRLAGRGAASASEDVVESTLSDGTLLSLFLTGKPRVLTGVDYTAELPGLGDSVVSWRWRGWKNSPALGLAPSGHTVRVNGVVFQEVEYSRYEAGSPDAAAMMEIPSDLTPDAASRAPVPAAGPATGEVAPGVHVARIGSFMTAFVELSDSVVVFDAPASTLSLESIPAGGQADTARVAAELRSEIARTCPGKPVRFVVVSHHHGDHLGGLPAFAGAGVTILAAPGDVAAVRRSLAGPRSGPADERRDPGSEASVEAVPDRRRIGDGRGSLEILAVGPNPHTAEGLALWLPDERLMFEGDLFYYEEGAPFPPAGRALMNRFFAGWLAGRNLRPRAVYGVHYAGAAGPEALARAAPPGENPLEIYLASIALLSAHDADGQLATYAPGAVVVDPDGTRRPVDLSRQRGVRGFEAATRAQFDYAIVRSAADLVEAIEIETNDFVDALGARPVESRRRYRYCKARLCELAVLERDEDYERRLRLFRRWLVTNAPASERSRVLDSGGIVFDEKSAPSLVALARRWNQETAAPRPRSAMSRPPGILGGPRRRLP